MYEISMRINAVIAAAAGGGGLPVYGGASRRVTNDAGRKSTAGADLMDGD